MHFQAVVWIVSQILRRDAPGESGLNSRIDFKCTQDNVYRVIATSLGGGSTGNFTVLVKN